VIVAARYSFNGGAEVVAEKYSGLLEEIELVIADVGAVPCKVKVSKEKTMPGQVLFSPVALNKAFTAAFYELGWRKKRVSCRYSTED